MKASDRDVFVYRWLSSTCVTVVRPKAEADAADTGEQWRSSGRCYEQQSFTLHWPPFSHPPGKGCTRDHGLTVRTKVISDAALCVGLMLMTFGLAAGLGQQVASECMRQVVLVAGMSAARIQIDVV